MNHTIKNDQHENVALTLAPNVQIHADLTLDTNTTSHDVLIVVIGVICIAMQFHIDI
jgi:hypothetical protein